MTVPKIRETSAIYIQQDKGDKHVYLSLHYLLRGCGLLLHPLFCSMDASLFLHVLALPPLYILQLLYEKC